MKLEATIIRSKDTGYYTAFINEFPGILAQSKDQEELKTKLEKTFENFLTMRSKDIKHSEPNTLTNDI